MLGTVQRNRIWGRRRAADAWELDPEPESLAHQELYKGYRIEIHRESYPQNPYEEFDNIGTMNGWHRDTAIGENRGQFREWQDFLDYLKERRQERHSKDAGVLALEIHLRHCYGHNYYTEPIDENPDRGWPFRDSKPDGVIWIDYEDARRKWDVKKLTPKVKEHILAALKSEVYTYGAWACGDVFGFVIADGADDNIDSCWGFYGNEEEPDDGGALAEAKSIVDGYVDGERVLFPFLTEEDEEAEMEGGY